MPSGLPSSLAYVVTQWCRMYVSESARTSSNELPVQVTPWWRVQSTPARALDLLSKLSFQQSLSGRLRHISDSSKLIGQGRLCAEDKPDQQAFRYERRLPSCIYAFMAHPGERLEFHAASRLNAEQCTRALWFNRQRSSQCARMPV